MSIYAKVYQAAGASAAAGRADFQSAVAPPLRIYAHDSKCRAHYLFKTTSISTMLL